MYICVCVLPIYGIHTYIHAYIHLFFSYLCISFRHEFEKKRYIHTHISFFLFPAFRFAMSSKRTDTYISYTHTLHTHIRTCMHNLNEITNH